MALSGAAFSAWAGERFSYSLANRGQFNSEKSIDFEGFAFQNFLQSQVLQAFS